MSDRIDRIHPRCSASHRNVEEEDIGILRQSDPIGNVGPLAAITEVLARNWWVIALRGGVAILFGVLAWVMPVVTLAALVLLYGTYALVDGIFNVAAAVVGRSGARPSWTMLLAGLVSIAAGLVTFLMPGSLLSRSSTSSPPGRS